MEEARFSFNLKFSVEGLESQLTVRAGESESLGSFRGSIQEAIRLVKSLGAVPRPGNNGKPKQVGHGDKPPQERLCPVCGKDDQLRLIEFTPKGSQKSMAKFKCERCNKWLPNGSGIPTQAELEELYRKREAVHAQAQRDIAELWPE